MTDFFATKTVVVTGGAGFLGKYVVAKLEPRARLVIVPRSSNCDLRKAAAIESLLKEHKPDIVLHLAGTVAGIGGTSKNPAGSFYDNLIMGTQTMEGARLAEVSKYVALGTVCSYPKNIPLPGRESSLWEGYPEETNAPYGMAKKMAIVQSDAYRRQYGFNSICLIAANLYGPGDNFDRDNSHVIPALIRKFVEAEEADAAEVTCWGDGTPTREFLYVDDCADAILLAAEYYDSSDPVNIGSGEEISISDLATLIAQLVGFEGKIRWDKSQPGGQPRRSWDTSKAWERFGFRAKKALSDGLQETIAWYRSHSGARSLTPSA